MNRQVVGEPENRLVNFFGDNGLFSDHFVGFCLFSPDEQEMIFNFNENHFFTPASNTKIFTLFAALNILKDSIPSFKYLVENDKLYIWGLGDPTTLHPEFDNNSKLISLLKSYNYPITVCKDHFISSRYGPGWSWDDYNYGYQVEKSHLPLYGNRIWINYDSDKGVFDYYPAIIDVEYASGEFDVQRHETRNHYQVYLPATSTSEDYRFGTPVYMSDTFLQEALSAVAKREITIADRCDVKGAKTLVFSTPAETVYSEMMQESDNFIAEQLLLAASGILFDTLASRMTIDLVSDRYLSDISSGLKWADGSGLSRYNQFTPLAIVNVLEKILKMKKRTWVKVIFPAGGVSGTIANWYAAYGVGEPFVFAKTGTLRGVHCLSGYVQTNSERLLIFSFMHNNIAGRTSTVKENMDKVLRYVKENY